MVDTTQILAGALPAAALALAADGGLAWLERSLSAGRRLAPAAGLAIAIAIVGVMALGWTSSRAASAIRVGSKNFTEQILLGELVSQALEDEGLPVVRTLNLGGTFICDRALRSGDIDMYVEYTGTAVSAIFHEQVPRDPAEALRVARDGYAAQNLSLLDPLGFNSSFAILVRGSDARRERLQSIGDLARVASKWRAGFGYEFLQREDGYPGLVSAYNLQFGQPPVAMDLSLIYKALADGRVDVIAGDATSGLIDALDLVALEDTRRYFPPYDAVPAVRTAALLERPAIRRALGRLAGRISEADMRAMNRAVDIGRKDPSVVARAFLAAHAAAR
jgi:osmoprotectant transport system permease protein